MALVTARFHILFAIQWPEPVFVYAMCFLNTGGGYSVAVVTRCTAESLRIVNLQKLLAGMTGEGSFPSHVCLRQG